MDENLDIKQESEVITGVAKGLKKGANLSEIGKKNVFEALLSFKNAFPFSSTPYRAVATEAFRMARDSDKFFDEIYEKLGIKFEIISGQTEAALVRGAINERLKRLGIESENALSIDLGGGSSEIVYKDQMQSFKFGILTFANRFESLNLANADITTKEARDFIKQFKFDKIVLNSGVPTTILAVKKNLNYRSYDANLINGGRLNFADFDEMREKILKMSDEEAEILVGKNRNLLIISGCLLLKSLLKDFATAPIFVVDDGLREGVCIDYYKRKK